MKKDAKISKFVTAFIATICLLLAATAASAVESAISNERASVLDYLTDKDGRYTGPTVEENILKMDSDKNGFADVTVATVIRLRVFKSSPGRCQVSPQALRVM